MRSWFSSSACALPIGLLLVAMLSVQTGASIAKQLFPHVGAQGATTLRLVITAVLMAAIWRPWQVRMTWREAGPVVGYGVALGVMNLTFYMALQTIPLGVAVALEFTGPLTVALIASRRPIDFAWIVLAVGGLFLLLPIRGLAAPLDLVGVGLALAAGACWALYIVFGQKAGSVHGGRTVALGALIAALIVTPFGLARAGAGLIDPAILPLALVVALLSSAIPNSLEMLALTRLPARTFGILMSLEPAVAALSGLLLLHETLTPIQLLAIGAVIAASAGTVATTRKPAPIIDPPV